MKLNIEELAREADLDHAEPDHNCRVPYFDMVTVKELEAFARLIVEMCAVTAGAAADFGCDGLSIAATVRKLLEAE